MKLYKKLKINEKIYQKIVEKLKREPNDFETHLFAAMHSEHCGYVHSKKYLNGFYTNNNLENENSGCIKIKDWAIFFKIESHNHPCAIEPYQGSMTGIGGIVRDVLSLGARPIALLNSLKFGNVSKNKTKYYLSEVVRGISTYGNSIGVATVGGETVFDEKFYNLPIVNVLAAGIVKTSEIKLSSAKEGNLIVLLGSKTGVDGLNGATFASDIHDKKASRQSVQIGDPYTKKNLIEAVCKITKLPEVVACQDLGASGILSSTSEMGYKGNCAIELYLDKVHLQNSNITPVEMMLSETQERMAFVVSESGMDEFEKIAREYDLGYSIIGKTFKGNYYRVFYRDKILCDVDLKVLCEPYLFDLEKSGSIVENPQETTDLKEKFLDFIKNDNFSKKDYIYSCFDQEVQGRTSFSQKNNSTGVLYLKETNSFIAFDIKTSFDKNPKKALYDSFMYLYRKLIAVGFTPEGLTNCLNFASPEDKITQSDFLNTIDELKRLSNFYKIPVVSGNVSFYNEKQNEKIPPCATLAFVGTTNDKNLIKQHKINLFDHLFLINKMEKIEDEKNLIFELKSKNLVKKILIPSESGLLGVILKNALFYNLGFKIKTDKTLYFKEFLESYILIADKKDELQKYLKNRDFSYLGQFVDDKIIFDDFVFSKNEIKKIYENKIINEMG